MQSYELRGERQLQNQFTQFGDGRKRDDKGRFVRKPLAQHISMYEPHFKYSFDLSIGKYHFGSFSFELGLHQVAIFAEVETISSRKKIDKNLLELYREANFHPELLQSLQEALHSTHRSLDLTKVIVKEVFVEGPGGAIEFGVGLKENSRAAHLQAGAIGVVLETEVGIINAKLSAGLGAGISHHAITGKNGKPGTKTGTSITTAMWSVGFVPKENAKSQANPKAVAFHAKVAEEQQKAAEFVKTIERPQTENKSKACAMGKRQTSPNKKKFSKKALTENTEKEKQISDEVDLTDEILTAFSKNQENSNFEFSGSELTAIQHNLFDEVIKRTVTAVDSEPEMQSLYGEYKKSAKDVKAFMHFQEETITRFKSEENINAILEASKGASLFIGEIGKLTKSKNLQLVAASINAGIQAFTGLSQVANGIQLIKSATDVTGKALAFGTFMGGAGLVMSAISMMSPDEGQGEALEAISNAVVELHNTVITMWSEFRESFQYTWELQELTLHILDEIEKNNWERYERTIAAIEYVHYDLVTRVARNTELLRVGQAFSYSQLKSYLDHIVDGDVKKKDSINREDGTF